MGKRFGSYIVGCLIAISVLFFDVGEFILSLDISWSGQLRNVGLMCENVATFLFPGSLYVVALTLWQQNMVAIIVVNVVAAAAGWLLYRLKDQVALKAQLAILTAYLIFAGATFSLIWFVILG